MISTHVSSEGRPRVLAVFSFRYDAHLVPDMLSNIAPMVDGWVAFDDRDSQGIFTNEVSRRRRLLEVAADLGAGWVLAVDPDERFERAMGSTVRTLVEEPGPVCYTFALREMYGGQMYRTDGVWGQKRQARMLSLANGIADPGDQLHLPWSYFVPDFRLIDTGFNLYHLKMITRERREARTALYNYLDPDGRMQRVGYDYLRDDTGAVFETIPAGREYHPAHEDDGGLWMPDVGAPT